jgi:hypothetical protein
VFQIAPQGYRFPAGHTLKLEVAANDFPYYQQDNIPSVVQVSRMALTLPVHEQAPAAATAKTAVLGASASAAAAAHAAPGAGALPATGGQPWAPVALALLALAALGVSAKGRASAR